MFNDLDVNNQRTINDHVVAVLAEKMHCDYMTVKHVYDDEFCKLEASARIRDYLVVLASRRTIDLLRGSTIKAGDSLEATMNN